MNGPGRTRGTGLGQSTSEPHATAITPDDLPNYPLNIDEGEVSDSVDGVPLFADSENCQRTDSILGSNYECSYVGELYSDYVKGLTAPCDLS
ncbi:MAG: hypothetical protein Q9213_005221 [Squamulea squamosa]